MSSSRPVGGDDADEIEVPGYRNYIIYTDESGMHGAKYYGFGSLWIPWERRGDLQKQLRELRESHRLQDELKWKKVTRRTEPFVKDVIDWFFVRPWMMFHCLIVPREDVNMKFHNGRDSAQQKHFSMLLKNKISHFAKTGGKVYRVRVDPLPWRYPKSHEVVHKVVNAQLKQELGEPLIHDVIAYDSKHTIGIQIADLLLGAVIAAWQQEAESEPKLRVMQTVADKLGWPDLRHDTYSAEWKFNIWHFHAPPSGTPRKARTMEVQLKHAFPKRPAASAKPARRSGGRHGGESRA